MTFDCDILISGGGIAGLTAAAAFGAAGFDVICVDPTPPVTARDADGADLRTTAFLQPAQALLDQCGVWQRLQPHAMPLEIMRIVDAGGTTPGPRVVREFKAAEISDQPFGWNLPNWLLRREILAHLDRIENVTFRAGTATTSLFTRMGSARVGLSDGSKITTRLVLAVDGRTSPMREAAGIEVKTRRFGQMALAFAVTHIEPHKNVSTEVHRSGGPFTMVPLPDYQGLSSSAVVWMDRSAKAQSLMAMDEATFEDAMNTRSCDLLGRLSLASRRTIWPIISQTADRMAGQRLALMAEAAHVVPPIGAQGLNTSLQDLRCLLDLALARRDGLGDAQMLEAYHTARIKDVNIRMQGIDLLNRASMVQSQPLRDARAMGLSALYSLAPVRRALMQMGLGVR